MRWNISIQKPQLMRLWIMVLTLSTQKEQKPKHLAGYALLEKWNEHNHFVFKKGEHMINMPRFFFSKLMQHYLYTWTLPKRLFKFWENDNKCNTFFLRFSRPWPLCPRDKKIFFLINTFVTLYFFETNYLKNHDLNRTLFKTFNMTITFWTLYPVLCHYWIGPNCILLALPSLTFFPLILHLPIGFRVYNFLFRFLMSLLWPTICYIWLQHENLYNLTIF